VDTWKDKLPPIGQLGPFIALLIACTFFGITTDQFFSSENFSLILQQVMVVGVIAIGQTLIILTAGIDLSCGVVMALGNIVMTKFAADFGLPAPIAILCGIAVTAAFGLVNGLLVTRIKLPPFIVTLGTFNIAFAITQLYSKAQTVTEVPEMMTWLGGTFQIGATNVAYGTVLMILLYLGMWFWLRETAAGRHVYAVGNSPEATRLVGIPTERVLLGVYVLATSLFGGRGVILGTLVGAIVVGVLRNGLTLMGVDSVYQVLVTGILVILAVTVDQLSRKGGR